MVNIKIKLFFYKNLKFISQNKLRKYDVLLNLELQKINTININDIAPGYTNPVGTYSFNIVDKDPVVITGVFTGQATCYGYSNGGVEVSVTGGTGTYNYTWSPGTHPNSPIITGLSAGNYTVQVTDSNGCASTVVPFTITEPPQITYTSNVTAPTCYGGADGSKIGRAHV